MAQPLTDPALRFVRETAEAQLKRARVTLGPDWRRHPPVQPETPEHSAKVTVQRRAAS